MSILTLVAVFAHPDDEAFGVGGALSRYAAEGVQVHVVTATRGEAGGIADAALATPANLAYVREQELRCACQAYGIQPPQFLGYTDGQMANAHQGQAVGKVVRLLREVKPQVVITFGPEGIYGHYDHIAAHRWATIAVELAADPHCFPGNPGEPCQPHTVSKMYYRVLAEEDVVAMPQEGKRASVMMDGVPFYFVGYEAQEITTIVDVSAYAEAKLRGIRCHATQLAADNRFAQASEEMLQEPMFRRECFILAHSTVGRLQGVETDLFAGLR